jgi:hypothetical protein
MLDSNDDNLEKLRKFGKLEKYLSESSNEIICGQKPNESHVSRPLGSRQYHTVDTVATPLRQRHA